MMKSQYLLILLTLVAAGCSNEDKKAAEMYAQAERYYDEGNYYTAKLWIDSIEASYPKAFDVIRDGMVLQCRINRKVYEHDLVMTDSLYNMAKHSLEELKPLFELTRETEYQTERNYIYKKAHTGSVIKASGLRAQVTESGDFRLISIYTGSHPINHTGIRIVSPDGSYCATDAVPYDGARNYRFTNDGKTTEIVTYNKTQCYAVAELIVLSSNRKLTVDYTGGKKYAIPLDKNTCLAIAETYRLAQVLSLTDSLAKRREYGIRQLEIADAQLIKLEEQQQAEAR